MTQGCQNSTSVTSRENLAKAHPALNMRQTTSPRAATWTEEGDISVFSPRVHGFTWSLISSLTCRDKPVVSACAEFLIPGRETPARSSM